MKSQTRRLVTFLALGLILCAPLKTSAQEGDNRHKLNTVLEKIEDDPQPPSLTQDLIAVHDHSASSATRSEAAYVLARNYQKSIQLRDHRKAIPLFVEASKVPSLWELCQWHIFQQASELKDDRAAQKALNAIRANSLNPDSQARAAYELGRYYYEQGDLSRAYDMFIDLQQSFPASTCSTEALYYLGEIDLQQSHNEVLAIALFRQYLSASATGGNARQAIDALCNIQSFKATAADYERFGHVYYLSEDYARAYEQWSHAPSVARFYEEGVCLDELGRGDESSRKLRGGITACPNDAAVPAAADLLLRLHRYDRSTLLAFWQKFPIQGSVNGDVALWSMANLTDGAVCQSYFQELVDEYPQSHYEPAASYCLFMPALRSGDTKVALSIAEKSANVHPHSAYAPRFAFWTGKIHEAQKEPALAAAAYSKAAADYPADYYGYRSQGRLLALNGGTDPGWSTQPARKHPEIGWSWPDPQGQLDLSRLDANRASTLLELSILHQWDECFALCPANQVVFRSSLLARMRKPREAINGVAETLGGAPQRDPSWTLAYPVLYGKIVDQEATADGVDPLLVYALIRQESRFMEDALSHSGAIGLMQLMPFTASDVARKVNLPLYGRVSIFKPENNIKMGTWYIGQVTDEFGGDPMFAQGKTLFAVAGYNGGPTAVRGWYKSFLQSGKSDLDLFAEEIPKDETRDYVKQVFQNLWNYQQVYR